MKITTHELTERYEELCFVSMAVAQELAIMQMILNFEPTMMNGETYTFVSYNIDEETVTLQCDKADGDSFMPTFSFDQFIEKFQLTTD